MKTFRLAIVLAACAASLANADVVVTTPAVGYQKLLARAESDTRLSIALVKRPVLTGRVTAVAASSIALSGVALTDGFFAAGPSGSYHAQVLTGGLAGLCFPIVGNTSETISLDTQGDDLTNHPLGSLLTGVSGDVVRIRSFWSIGDIWGSDVASLLLDSIDNLPTGPYATGDAVFLPDAIAPGTDKKPSATLYYVSGHGWRTTIEPDANAVLTPLPPGRPFKVRRHNSLPAEALVIGDAPSEPFRLRIPALSAGQEMDVDVALARSTPTTLALSGLFSSGTETVLNASNALLDPVDLLIEYNSDRHGFSLPSEQRYHVVGAGWFDAAGSADSHVLMPGEGYVLRLRGERAARYWLQSSSE